MRRLCMLFALLGGLPTVSHALPFDCLVEPKSTVSIVAGDRGRIAEILVARGDLVAKGAPLVRLESTVQELQVRLYAARVASDVELRANAAEVERNRRAFERASELQSRNVVTATAVEDAEIAYALSQLGLEQALATRTQTEIELAQAEAILNRRTILSPVDAVVTNLVAAEGEYAHEQFDIMELSVLDPLKVRVFVTAEYFGRIREGDRFPVAQVAPLDGVFEAEVTVIDRVFDAASNTFGVQLDLPNPDGAIPAGTRCLIDFD